MDKNINDGIVRFTHPLDKMALSVYDRIWAEANHQRWIAHDHFLADKLEDVAADLYIEIRERAQRR